MVPSEERAQRELATLKELVASPAGKSESASSSVTTTPTTIQPTKSSDDAPPDPFYASIKANMKPISVDEPTNATQTDEDKAVAIRRQVDFYYSEENLFTDHFLRRKMKESENRPIPVEIIHGFQKMQVYQPRSFVVEALRSSTTVDVVQHEGKDCIVRKTAYSKLEHRVRNNPGVQQQPKVKGPRPTGFEEYYTDAPVTPAEYEEEQDLYDPDRPFAERIETAIQKYKAKRRFHSRSSEIFSKWMKFGGILTGPKQFSGGVDQADLQDKTSAEIARMTATEFCREEQFDDGPDAKWSVDFEGVIKGFLSSFGLAYFEFQSQDAVVQCTKIIRNFYNYILHHNVAPEYAEQIIAARKVCDMADAELFKLHQIKTAFPGEFNVACSTLFGGQYGKLFSKDIEWTNGATETELGMTKKRAQQVCSMGIAAYGPVENFVLGQSQAQKHIFEQRIIDTESCEWFEVTAVVHSDDKTRELYNCSEFGAFTSVGKLRCKPWDAPHFTSLDLGEGFQEVARPDSYEFLVEDTLLENCFLGMKFQATIHKLSDGLLFIDMVITAFPSFYELIENELFCSPESRGKWNPWKEPKEYTREELMARDARGDVTIEDADPVAGELDAPGDESE